MNGQEISYVFSVLDLLGGMDLLTNEEVINCKNELTGYLVDNASDYGDTAA